MPIYVVLAKDVVPGGAAYINNHMVQQQNAPVVEWPTVGVFQAPDADTACRAAARKSQRFGTFIALLGYAWGVDVDDVPDAAEFGVDDPKLSGLQQLEQVSSDAERRAGIGPDAEGAVQDADPFH